MNTPQSMSTDPSAASQSAVPAIPAFDDFDFDADDGFQAGLKSVLAGITDESEKAEAIAKAKRFYYSWFNGKAATAAVAPPAPSPPQPAPEQQQQEPETDSDALRYPPSFAEIVQMVAEGKPIPGVREIPDTVADAPPSQPALKPRLKPWETASASDSSSSPTGTS